jgi:hypothetical protein
MKKTFYEVLWSICQQEGHLQQWIDQGYLRHSQSSYIWTDKIKDLLGPTAVIGKLQTSVVSTPPEEKKVPFSIEPNQLKEFIDKFGKQNIGLAGKTTEKNNVLRKLIKFFKEYPEYTMTDVLTATDLYINNLRKTGSLQYIRECGYFVYKKIDGVDQSDLAKWCEEGKSGGTTYSSHRVI